MTDVTRPRPGEEPLHRRPDAVSLAVIAASIAVSVALSVAMNVALLMYAGATPDLIVISVATINAACVSMSVVGGLIEWRRRGHAIGRLLLLGGPLYAFLTAGWTTGDALAPHVDAGAWAVVALSTLAVAAMFGPARRRVQSVIDRRFHRSRYDAGHTVATFAAQLRDQVVPEHISALLVNATASALQPAVASVWLRRSSVDPT